MHRTRRIWIRGGSWRAGLLAASCLAAGGCGGDSSPVAPVPVPAATPTPVPRTTFSLAAPADYYQLSSPLTLLTAGQSFELTVRPMQINEAPDEEFAHAVEVWLWSDTATRETFTDSGLALSLMWLGDSEWSVSYYTPERRWRDTNQRVQIRLGDQSTVRVVRRTDGFVEFLLGGTSVLTLSDSEARRSVLARVVGAAAEFSYVPQGAASAAQLDSPTAAAPCGDCVAGRDR